MVRISTPLQVPNMVAISLMVCRRIHHFQHIISLEISIMAILSIMDHHQTTLLRCLVSQGTLNMALINIME